MGSVIDLTAAKAAKEKQVAEADPKLTAALIELREYVDNINRVPDVRLAGTTYQARQVNGKIHSIPWEGCEIGYRLLEGPDRHIMKREIFVRFGQRIRDIPEAQKDPIMLAVMEAFLMEGQGPVEMETFRFGNRQDRKEKRHDSVRLAQDFSLILLNRSGGPGQVSFDESVLKEILK